MHSLEHWDKASKIKKETDPYQDREEKIEKLLKDIEKNINIIKKWKQQ